MGRVGVEVLSVAGTPLAIKAANEINFIAVDLRVAPVAIAVIILAAAGASAVFDEREKARGAKQKSENSAKPPGENPRR